VRRIRGKRLKAAFANKLTIWRKKRRKWDGSGGSNSRASVEKTVQIKWNGQGGRGDEQETIEGVRVSGKLGRESRVLPYAKEKRKR